MTEGKDTTGDGRKLRLVTTDGVRLPDPGGDDRGGGPPDGLPPSGSSVDPVLLDHGSDVEIARKSGARRKDPEAPPVRPCPFCAAVIPLAVRRCPACGELVVAAGGERSELPILRHDTLEPLEVGSLRWLAAASYETLLQWAAGDEERLRQVQWARGYGEYWVTARQRDWGRRPVPADEV